MLGNRPLVGIAMFMIMIATFAVNIAASVIVGIPTSHEGEDRDCRR